MAVGKGVRRRGGVNNDLLTRQAVTHCSPFVGVGEGGRRLHSGTSHV